MQERWPDSPLDGESTENEQSNGVTDAPEVASGPSGLSPWRISIGVALVVAVVIVADQLTKSWAERELVDRIIEVGGPLQFALTYNRGMAFGIGSGVAPYLIALTIAAVLIVMIKKSEQLTSTSVVGIGLVLGGAIGNVCDRLFRDHNGAVVDFIDVGWWPVFNLADSAVVLGALVLVLVASRNDPNTTDAPETNERS